MASRRGYVTQDEVAEYANITILDTTEADDKISQAEEMIDAYVGYQEKFIECEHRGEPTSVSGRTVIDTSGGTQLFRTDGFFTGCVIEILGGTGAGQRKKIVSSSRDAYSVTVDSDWSTEPDTSSFFRIYQLGKFPRCRDVFLNNFGTVYYKSIPEAVKRAVAAQVEFFVGMGDDYFSTDKAEMQSESLGNYSYSKGSNSQGESSTVRTIAPKTRLLLKGIKNSTGRLVPDATSNW